MLHLHGFEDAHLGPLRDQVAHLHPDLHHAPGHGGEDGAARLVTPRGAGHERRHRGRGVDRPGAGVRGSRGQERGELFLDEARVHLLGGELLAVCQGLQQPQVGGQALDAALGQGAPGAAARIGEPRRRAVHDQLGQQRVVVGRRREARIPVRVDAHARAAGQVEAAQGAAGRAGLAVRVQRLGVDAPLDRETLRRHGTAGGQAQVRQRLPGRDAELQLDEVKAGHGLGDGVLDLEARVGLDEDEGQRGRGLVDQELERAQAAVGHACGHAQGRGRDGLAQGLGQARAGRDLHELLEAPLQRAVAIAQADHLAAVAQHLDLDMARPRHQALDVHAVDTEGGPGLGAAALVGAGQVGGLQHGAHATPAAAADGLHHHAAALERVRGEEGLCLAQRDRARAAGHHGNFAPFGQGARRGLVTEQGQVGRRGPDEAHPGVGEGLRGVGALAEEAVAGVHRIAALLPGHLHQGGDVQVGGRAAGVQGHGGVGEPGVQGLRVVARADGHAGEALVPQRAREPDGDLPAVGDQYLVDHGVSGSRRWRRARAGNAAAAGEGTPVRVACGSGPAPRAETPRAC